MKSTLLFPLWLLAALGQAQNASVIDACAAGLYMIVARGSSEPPGVGRIGVVAGNVSEAIPGSTIVALDYPALFDPYNVSEAAGVAALTSAITKHTSACPSAKIALIGWSQGAQVATDSLCGTDDRGLLGITFEMTPDLASAYENNSRSRTR